ncbi:LON peptidase substrate-binding domain-containing protein [Hyphococcus flavus]|uniref:LON peptidase substrate-binding domain-containing protein n=1 Tax=Hyphococcus flavus TaxID=1866326 RepID=A0AAF0CGW0_9PROT|nr:LON peptidase substrate-binding domain-containing protein [Hyphococcus flavus]WDI32713.1 LON peptidase substrate-binding domain-containing protein [Hyphococcus flavus]
MEAARARRRSATPETLPLFPLEGAVLLPGGQLPLNIFEPRYLRMIDDALGGARLIGMIQPKDGMQDEKPALYDVGCAGRITSFAETDDGRYVITLTGARRFKLDEEVASDTPYRLARPDWSYFERDAEKDPTAEAVDRDELLSVLKNYLEAENLHVEWEQASNAPVEALIVSLAMGCPFAPNEKQAILETPSIVDQAKCLMTLMRFSDADDSGGDDPLLQ